MIQICPTFHRMVLNSLTHPTESISCPNTEESQMRDRSLMVWVIILLSNLYV
jgi:hypothetical protein